MVKKRINGEKKNKWIVKMRFAFDFNEVVTFLFRQFMFYSIYVLMRFPPT